MLGRIATSDKSDLRRFYPDNWRSLIALQVENLVINNRNWIWNKLGLEDQDGLCDGPFQQRATKALSGVQVDYMIQTRSKTIFVCEIKFSTGTLGHEVIDEVAEKVKKIKTPRGFAMLPVLIRFCDLSRSVEDEPFFYRVLDLSEMIDGDSN